MFGKTIFLGLAGFASVLSLAAPASAHDAHWRHHHPRQAQVLHRDHHQMHRINAERRHGEITGGQARALRQNDRAIAHEDHADARANGGKITHAEQKAINQELNAQSKAIGH